MTAASSDVRSRAASAPEGTGAAPPQGGKPASARPLRVALMTTSVEFGGIERVVLNLLEHMGPEVEFVPLVFTRTDTAATGFFERLHAAHVRYEPIYVNAIRPALVASPLANLAQIVGCVRNQRIDLIHSHGYRADVFALAVSRLFGIPVVATCHGFTPTDARLRVYCALDARILRAFAAVIAVSAEMRRDLECRGIRPDRIHLVPNAVPEVAVGESARMRHAARARIGLTDDHFVYGYVGRLSLEKGVEHLLDAFALHSGASPNSRLLVVGDGPSRPGLERQAIDRGVGSRVVFTGFRTDTDVWYSALDAFVLPSLTEGTPMALLEAMNHGVPAIASAVGGVPAVLTDGANGLLVPPGDVARLAAAMETLAASSSLRRTLAEAGAQTVRRQYNVREWVNSIRDVYARSAPSRRQHQSS